MSTLGLIACNSSMIICCTVYLPWKTCQHHSAKILGQRATVPSCRELGQDPSLALYAGNEVPYGISEYELVGGLKGSPVEVVEAPETGLPIPKDSEIVIEGYCYPDDNHAEGPFPEWTGYYLSLI